jgi:formate dehydrogenase subunit gamma
VQESTGTHKIQNSRAGRQTDAARHHTPEKKYNLNRDGHVESEVLRFLKSERALHWAIAVPFIVCWITALVLVLVYNPDPLRPYRQIFSWVHRISGAALIVLPALALLFGRKEHKIHLQNIRTAVRWSLNDLKWLALMVPAAVSKKIVLPEQGKFNAAEKVNFIMVMMSVPLLISSGVLVWSGNWAWVAWLVHVLTAILATPTMLGHIYMATINAETRVGIKGMITGYVDRRWVKHHYAIWYREHFEKEGGHNKSENALDQDHLVQLVCPRCATHLSVRWGWLLPRLVAAVGVTCPGCGRVFFATDGVRDAHNTNWGELRRG